MQQLFNFSVYKTHIDRFDNNWQTVAEFSARMGFDGIELLVGVQPFPVLPTGLTRGIHLPYWIQWLEIWRDGDCASVSDNDRQFLADGARDASEMIKLQHDLWSRVAVLQPDYAVFHISHVSLVESFTRCHLFSDEDVMTSAIELLNATAATFPGGEPPVLLLFENLWWPGLTFRNPALVDYFVDRLRFNNWGFCLDTGHLVNTQPCIKDEEEAIDFILECITRLSPKTRHRIENIHLNLSLSGGYQRASLAAGLPAGFTGLPFTERFILARNHVSLIDEHRPFTSARCRMITDAVNPRFVTHELLMVNTLRMEQNLIIQHNAFNTNVLRKRRNSVNKNESIVS